MLIDSQPCERRWYNLFVKRIRQRTTYDCGHISALMVANFLIKKKPVSPAKVLKAVKTTENGTSQTNLVKGLRSLGLNVSLDYNLDFAAIKNYINSRKLIIVYEHSMDHWMVVNGYNTIPVARLRVSDPGPFYGVGTYRYSYLLDKIGNFGIVCSSKY